MAGDEIFRWLDAEVALMLNWRDHCLQTGKDYNATVTDEILKLTRKDGTRRADMKYKQVQDKLRHLLTGPRRDTFLKQGTSCLQLNRFSPELVKEMNYQRASLALEPFHQKYEHLDDHNSKSDDCVSSDSEKLLKTTQSIGLTKRALDLHGGIPPDQSPGRTSEKSRMDVRQLDDRSVSHVGAAAEIRSGFNVSRATGTFDQSVVHTPPRTISRPQNPTLFQAQEIRDTPGPTFDISSPTVSPLTVASASRTGFEMQPPTLGMADIESHNYSSSTGDVSTKVDISTRALAKLLELQKAEKDNDTELRSTMSLIQEIVSIDPSGALLRVIELFAECQQAKSEYQTKLRKLVGRQDFLHSPSFPKLPAPEAIREQWKATRREIQALVGEELPLIDLEPRSIAGFVTCIDKMLRGHAPEANDLTWIIPFSQLLQSPHALQYFMSAWLCSRVFCSPEPMCAEQHPQQTMELYMRFRLTHGIATVQHLDMEGTKLFFESSECKNGQFQKRGQELCLRVFSMIKFANPSAAAAQGFDTSSVWIERLIELKQTLISSPKEYRIQFVPRGSLFDAQWMQAEDDEGLPIVSSKCFSKHVKLCLFPALAVHPVDQLAEDADIYDALAAYKRFIPSEEETAEFKPVNVIAKAYVIVE